jgi:DNA-binding NtrC family response regulator
MKTYLSNAPRGDLSRQQSYSALTSPARICEPTETLLVVDDDSMVRDVESQILRLQGYTVLEAEGAADALRLAPEAAAIHLLITDFSMPEVNGLELTHQFRALHPKSPVLMVSGSFPLIQDEVKSLDHFEFLAKPFLHHEFLNKVRALLEAVAPLPVRKHFEEHS